MIWRTILLYETEIGTVDDLALLQAAVTVAGQVTSTVRIGDALVGEYAWRNGEWSQITYPDTSLEDRFIIDCTEDQAKNLSMNSWCNWVAPAYSGTEYVTPEGETKVVDEEPQYVTPWSGEVPAGDYEFVFPETHLINGVLYRFSNWRDLPEGDPQKTSPIRTVTLLAGETVSIFAEYVPVVPQHTLAVTATPINVSVDVNGVAYQTPTGPITLDEGTYVVTVPEVVTTPEQYTFVRWNDGSTNPAITINLTSDVTLEATYAVRTFDLTIRVAGSGSGTTDPSPGTYPYPEGTVVAVKATPAPGSRFDHWTLNETNVGADNPYSVTMDANYILTAVFTKEEYLLTIATSGTGAGTTEPMPGTYPHVSGTVVPVTALPAEDGSYFDYWILDGADAGSDNPISVTMLADHSLVAVFTKPVPPDRFDLTISPAIGGTTDPPPGVHRYDEGTQVSVTALPDTDAGCTFGKWVLDGTDVYDNPISVTMDANHTLQPIFNAPPKHQLSMGSTPVTGVLVSVNGATYLTPASDTLPEGTYVVMVPATHMVGEDKYVFAKWEDESTEPSRTLDLTTDTAIVATYVLEKPPEYVLTLTATEGGTTNPPPDSYTYVEGAVVQVTAVPLSAEYMFSHWMLDGEDVGSENPFSVTMDADHQLHAVFTKPDKGFMEVRAYRDSHEIVVPYEVRETGKVGSTPDIFELNPGTYTVDGTFEGEVKTETVHVVAEQTVTVNLVWAVTPPPKHMLTVNSTPITGVVTDINGCIFETPISVELEQGVYVVAVASSVLVGEELQVTRVAPAVTLGDNTYQFTHWDDGSTSPIRVINLTADTSIVATYELVIPPPPPKGKLLIRAFLDDHEIVAPYQIVEAQLSGTTPGNVDLLPGTYTVTATYQNQTKSGSVVVSEGLVSRIDFKFTTEPPSGFPGWVIPALAAGVYLIVA